MGHSFSNDVSYLRNQLRTPPEIWRETFGPFATDVNVPCRMAGEKGYDATRVTAAAYGVQAKLIPVFSAELLPDLPERLFEDVQPQPLITGSGTEGNLTVGERLHPNLASITELDGARAVGLGNDHLFQTQRVKMNRRPNAGYDPAVAERPLMNPLQARRIVGEHESRDPFNMLTEFPKPVLESTGSGQVFRTLGLVFQHVSP